jgi:hypothetical protein
VVRLHVSVEDGHDRDSLRLGEGGVVVDEADVRVDDGELAVGLAPQYVGGAGGLVVQELSEVHARLREFQLTTLDKLSTDLLNINR